jgi:hypothetical protein
MEYGHRMWGRLIGAFFVIPAAIFWRRGIFNPAMKKKVLIFGSLIGFQVNLPLNIHINNEVFTKLYFKLPKPNSFRAFSAGTWSNLDWRIDSMVSLTFLEFHSTDWLHIWVRL